MGKIWAIVRTVFIAYLVFRFISWLAKNYGQRKKPEAQPPASGRTNTIDLSSKGRKKDAEGNDVETFGP
jgi:hypothetical protein